MEHLTSNRTNRKPNNWFPLLLFIALLIFMVVENKNQDVLIKGYIDQQHEIERANEILQSQDGYIRYLEDKLDEKDEVIRKLKEGKQII